MSAPSRDLTNAHDNLRTGMVLGVHREHASPADYEMIDVATHAKVDAV